MGSNPYNLLGVIGIGAIVAPGGIPVAPAALAHVLPLTLVTIATLMAREVRARRGRTAV